MKSDLTKRVGVTTMVAAVVLAIVASLISDDLCGTGSNLSSFQSFLYCLQISLVRHSFEERLIDPSATDYFIWTKYVVLLCVGLFALGFLWHKAVWPVPEWLAKRFHPKDE